MLNQSKGSGGSGNGGGTTPPVVVPFTPQVHRKDEEPGWADGLRKLYNSVVDEPLPASFESLLRKLDESEDD